MGESLAGLAKAGPATEGGAAIHPDAKGDLYIDPKVFPSAVAADLPPQIAEALANAQLPLNAKFVDDTGAPVTLGKYFDGKHPVILSTVYYNCPMLCSEELDGLTGALEMVHLVPGKDFQIVVVSIDPSETTQTASRPTSPQPSPPPGAEREGPARAGG